MDKDEFCRFLSSMVEGDTIRKISTKVIFKYDGAKHFTDEDDNSDDIGYVFEHHSEYEIVEKPRITVFQLHYDTGYLYDIFTSSSFKHCIPYLFPECVKEKRANNLRITIEEIL